MPLIYWTPDLAVGVERIDDQHRQLFKAADDLAEAMWAGKKGDEVKKTIDFMLDYTSFHFKDEEEVMVNSNYPGYAAQQQAHVKFVSVVSDLKQKFEADEFTSSSAAIEVLTTACDWFRTHIREMDKKLGDYLKELEED
jgi:hemerythrin